ncbi:MAG: gamma-glutamyl-gamma-aminobutyrate hydrolase family protein [Actinobacteria bacterium]|jgi:putative glutamine amidotransferase|nr:gamma-glutamyl-gamma-aminobutyrate hydrolase family protein [Actinomycetota bacterium]
MLDGSTSHPPLIGITGRQSRGNLIGSPDGFADAPIDIYLREYAQSVALAGGIAVHVPLETDAASMIDRLDGLIIAGGEDVDPRLYGQVPGPHTPRVDPLRDETEIALLRAADARGIPVLGVCRGQQLINVAFGGTLIQHLESGDRESHMSTPYPRAHRVHEVSLTPGTVAHDVYGDLTRVNSYHHQAIDRPGEGVVVTGMSPDGIIEAIEIAGRPIIAVQWHPECFSGDPIFTWLVDRARFHTPAPSLSGSQALSLDFTNSDRTHTEQEISHVTPS